MKPHMPFITGVLLACLAALHVTAVPKVVPTRADVSYGPHPHQLLDVYLPPEGGGPFPVLLWYGGVFGQARKNVIDVNKMFPAHCAVISVETRSLDDSTAAGVNPPISWVLLDARRAVQFVRLHATEWNLLPERIAVGGGSQGTLPALYVACAGDRVDPKSSDPVERVSTKVVCVAAWRSQPSLDPKRMQEWVPGVEWGSGTLALHMGFAEPLKMRDELLPVLAQWSPDYLLNKDTPPIYFENNWGIPKPNDPAVTEKEWRVHSPLWGLGFQKLARQYGVTCHVKYPDHPTEHYKDIWDFVVQHLQIPLH